MMGMTLKIVRRYVASGELKTTKNNNTYSISEEDFNAFKKYIKEGGDAKRAQKLQIRSSQMLNLIYSREQNTRHLMITKRR